MTCERCNGTGEIEINIPSTIDNPAERDVPVICPECEGTGRVEFSTKDTFFAERQDFDRTQNF